MFVLITYIDIRTLKFLQQSYKCQNWALLEILPWLKSYELPTTAVVPAELWEQQELWLLRRGEILHASGQKLIPGTIYHLDRLPKTGGWMITADTELYSLAEGASRKKLQSLPSGSANTQNSTSISKFKTLSESKNPGFNSRQVDENVASKTINTKASRVFESQTSTANKTQTQTPPKNHKSVSKAYFPSPALQVSHFWQQISRRYPFFLQQSASDCGAACLVMVSRYWGKRFSMNRLRELASVDRNGASLNGLASAAEGLGFSTRMVTASLDRLAEQSLPAIAHWQGNHYIVVYNVTPHRVIVVDPAIGQLSLTHEKFKAGWSGYTLLLRPTAFLKKTAEGTSSLWRFFELLTPYRNTILEIAIASIVLQL